MPGYRAGSRWNDLNELRCLLAFMQLREKGFPRNFATDLAKEIARLSGLPFSSVKAKIGNYKSVAGVTGDSNASLKTIYFYKKYGQLRASQLQELISSGKSF